MWKIVYFVGAFLLLQGTFGASVLPQPAKPQPPQHSQPSQPPQPSQPSQQPAQPQVPPPKPSPPTLPNDNGPGVVPQPASPVNNLSPPAQGPVPSKPPQLNPSRWSSQTRPSIDNSESVLIARTSNVQVRVSRPGQTIRLLVPVDIVVSDLWVPATSWRRINSRQVRPWRRAVKLSGNQLWNASRNSKDSDAGKPNGWPKRNWQEERSTFPSVPVVPERPVDLKPGVGAVAIPNAPGSAVNNAPWGVGNPSWGSPRN